MTRKCFAFMQTLSLAPIKKSYNFQMLNIIVAQDSVLKGQVLTKGRLPQHKRASLIGPKSPT